MKKITEIKMDKKVLPTKIIQFGEGNFLRAFIDWQIQQMNNQQLFNGGITIVQPIENGMIDHLEAQKNLYTVTLEGLLDGDKVQSDEVITAINNTINPYTNFSDYLKLAEEDTIEVIFSNTTEAGITYDETDKKEAAPAKSYPGKLTQLLYKRFELGKPGFHIIPCELINYNGEKLKEIILNYADLWNLGVVFKEWIAKENYFYGTLVDRIVPGFPHENKEEVFERIGYEDNMLVKAEAFLLFVIEGNKKLAEVLPFKEAGLNVIITDNMQPYRERKVRLLNGPHTTMTPLGLLAGIDTVGSVMNDIDFAPFIHDEMTKEISPIIDLPKEELASYCEAIKERFENPFVHHELQSIALNSISKYKTRLLPGVIQTLNETNQVPQRMVAALAALLVIYGNYDEIAVQPVDGEETIAKFKEMKTSNDYVHTVLSDQELWGEDLTNYPELEKTVKNDVAVILTQGARKLVQNINQNS
ncbi:tagaturonate reductase [Enterococcus hermanniensis]|uniref:Altronate oxidoreductase n=1 Tax=Enterococcus hermanniensis TaxID=249189 RepID=A0A1L8TPX2_9ENTE|nr:tagaturonate reductase [Enterococcus hermanniensis]OJG46124.1 altronate oxidoreductase [Enterococcus hermanniensis]